MVNKGRKEGRRETKSRVKSGCVIVNRVEPGRRLSCFSTREFAGDYLSTHGREHGGAKRMNIRMYWERALYLVDGWQGRLLIDAGCHWSVERQCTEV